MEIVSDLELEVIHNIPLFALPVHFEMKFQATAGRLHLQGNVISPLLKY